MQMEGVAAAIFYVSIAALIVGAMFYARGVIERGAGRDRRGLVLVLVGLTGIAISVAIYVVGPRKMLPF
jgi:small neutral amino acid transporter SnatA (MarC family)